MVYLGDIVIFSSGPKAHIKLVRKVLTLCRDAGIKIKLTKFTFFSITIIYLSQVFYAGQTEES